MAEPTGQARSKTGARNGRTASVLLALVLAMGGLAYASVPLYSLFCQVTGFGGTTQVAESAPAVAGARRISVRFNGDVDNRLPWRFAPEQREVALNVGEQGLAFYRAENLGQQATVGTATFNVTPPKAGRYFNKVACFCFEEQSLEPGEAVDMGVSFFVDPAIEDDPNLAEVTTITLSYTFFRAHDDLSPDEAARRQVSEAPRASRDTTN